MDKKRKAILGWALYDWANSAFATTVMAGFFPIFFKEYWSRGVDVNTSTAQLGLGNSVAGIIVALMAPLLGAVADRGGLRKRFLVFFAYLGVLMTASLFWIGEGAWGWAVILYVMGVVGFSGANVFYDSLLPAVAGEKNIDVVSGLGFAAGYLGGGLLFLLNVVMALYPSAFGFQDASQAVRFAFVMVAVWWGGFTVFTVLWVPEKRAAKSSGDSQGVLFGGIRQLFGTLVRIRHARTVFLFLAAYWFYIDGVDTIIRMAVDYGMAIGFEWKDLVAALLIVQFVGFPAALAFGKLGQGWGVRKGIYLALCVYLVATLWGAMMTQRHEFYVLALMIGLVQGGIQALSRSYYSRLIPLRQSGEFYGFYNMMGKFAAIIGPALMGIVGLGARRVLLPETPTPEEAAWAGQLASRLSLVSVALLFVAGGIILYFVDEKKGKREVAVLTGAGRERKGP
ncbi:MAG: MFS transporter [Deltaproteobacteria bacterium]|nr:MFS transporter [Deltaproteobacteria bacterium]